MTDPRSAIPSKAWPYLHALLVALGTGATTFLTGAFLAGMPTTPAAWRALLVGATALALSRMFGVMLKKFGP